jgi:hypothetical protein
MKEQSSEFDEALVGVLYSIFFYPLRFEWQLDLLINVDEKVYAKSGSTEVW